MEFIKKIISPLMRTARSTAQWRSSMVAITLRSLVWNLWVFNEHFELPQKTLSSLLTYRLRPFQERHNSLLSPLNSELKEVTEQFSLWPERVTSKCNTLSLDGGRFELSPLCGGLARTEPLATPGPRPAIAIAPTRCRRLQWRERRIRGGWRRQEEERSNGNFANPAEG